MLVAGILLLATFARAATESGDWTSTTIKTPRETRDVRPVAEGMLVLNLDADQGAILRFVAEAGWEYEIQWTSSLIDGAWRGLKTWSAETNGEVAVAVELPERTGIFRFVTRMAGEQEGGVYSRNAVGYTTITVSAGGMRPVSIPYDNPASPDGSYQFGETSIAQELPEGSVVYFWNTEKQKWGGGMKSAFGWDPAEAKHVLMPGEGFFVLNPSAENVEVVATGMVPTEASLSRAYKGGPNLSIMAYPYPVSIAFDDTELASQLPNGACAYFWGGSSWYMYSKRSGKWSTNYSVSPGVAFFVKNVSGEDDGVWVVERPNDLP